jgi:hypothetical protein
MFQSLNFQNKKGKKREILCDHIPTTKMYQFIFYLIVRILKNIYFDYRKLNKNKSLKLPFSSTKEFSY